MRYVQRARGARAHRRRSEFDEFKPRYGTTLVCAFARSRISRSAFSRTTASCFGVGAERDAFHPALQPPRHPAAVLAERRGLHGRQGCRAARHREGRREARHRRRVRARAEAHVDHRRVIRRRQLRDVRPRVRAAVPLDLAELADRGHGRRAGRAWCSSGSRGRPGDASDGDAGRPRKSRRNTNGSRTRITRARASGTTASSTCSTRAPCSARACLAANAPLPPETPFGILRM